MKTEKILNPNLVQEGRRRIAWAARSMPVLAKIKQAFLKQKPFKKARISACLHITKETAVLMEALKAGGAEIMLCASNPLSTQDSVAEALRTHGIVVHGKHGMNQYQYDAGIEACRRFKPDIVIDDGADLTVQILARNKKFPHFGLEETTTGVLRLRALQKAGKLRYPVFAVNDSPTKNLFDNVYGTGQSTLDALMRATNFLLAGKVLVVAGFGHCGRGIAARARGMGCEVVITEIDPVKAIQARMEGYKVLTMEQAAPLADFIITATGNTDVVDRRHFKLLKDGAVLANSGHFDVEIAVSQLYALADTTRVLDRNIVEAMLRGKKIYLLSQGRLVNLAAAEGHPSEVMDMSFANQALTAHYYHTEAALLASEVYEVPSFISDQVAKLKAEAMGVPIEELTPKQKKYLQSWHA